MGGNPQVTASLGTKSPPGWQVSGHGEQKAGPGCGIRAGRGLRARQEVKCYRTVTGRGSREKEGPSEQLAEHGHPSLRATARWTCSGGRGKSNPRRNQERHFWQGWGLACIPAWVLGDLPVLEPDWEGSRGVVGLPGEAEPGGP